MKTIYACKNTSHYRIIGLFIIVVSSIFIIVNLVKGYQGDFWDYYGQLISFSLNLIVGFFLFYFSKCNRYFVKFDTDKIIFKTPKNKLTEVKYKDIDSYEIHIFEIILHLKNGKTISINLEAFSYEQLKKVKEEFLKRF